MKNRPDWFNHEAYDFTKNLTCQQWAWEFLRRNEEYIQDYDWFIHLWEDLEIKYGRPPHRDFHHWKQDPLAYRCIADFESRKTAPANCAKDDNSNWLLIECWMGAKWGFYKFPQNPLLDSLQLSEEIDWHPVAYELESNSSELTSVESDDHCHFNIRFDLSLPLKPQLEETRKLLASERHRRLRDKSLLLSTIGTLSPIWTRCLRILDAEQVEADDPTVIKQLYDDTVDAATIFAKEQELARQLCKKKYRKILLIPPK